MQRRAPKKEVYFFERNGLPFRKTVSVEASAKADSCATSGHSLLSMGASHNYESI